MKTIIQSFNEPMVFQNKENPCVTIQPTNKLVTLVARVVRWFTKTKEKKEWLSRSAAVVGIVAIDDKILMVQRGPGCPDEVGKWVLPCGYVDWNENITQAMYREIKEETGINLLNVRKHAYDKGVDVLIRDDSFGDESDRYMGEGMPVLVRSNPARDKKQNISLYMAINIGSTPEYQFPLPQPTMNGVNPDETASIRWCSREEINQFAAHALIGFGHADQIDRYLKLRG